MKPWGDDKAWADCFLPEIERIIRSIAGQIVSISVADDDQDRTQGTDYVITVKAGTVACRIRRPTWADREGNERPFTERDLTIRYRRPLGTKTEWAKIMEGWGRWYLYAWAGPDGATLPEWIFVDLDRFRSVAWEKEYGPLREIANRDGSSSFVVIPALLLDVEDCLLARRLRQGVLA
jgi:hypothetical protein